MEFIKSLASNEWFIIASGVASILSLCVSGFTLWKVKIVIKQKAEKINNTKQSYNGDNGIQIGGDVKL